LIFCLPPQNFLQAVLGYPRTLLITAFALFAGLPCAFFIALARLNHVPVLHKIAGLYIFFVRGTPVGPDLFGL
jgi:L-cystine transport system permease protein